MKNTRYIILFVLLLAFSTAVVAQEQKEEKKKHLDTYTLAVGGGWNYYLNSMQVGKDYIQPNAGIVSFRFFWEPGELVSLGLETGYFRLFKAEKQMSADLTSTASTDVVPLTLLLRMRVIDHFYVSAGMGLAITMNKVYLGEEIDNTALSYSNFKFAASYLRPISKRFFVGGEWQFYNVGLTADWATSVQAVVGVKLR